MLAVLLLAALNPRPSLSLRLLTSRSPSLPLGVWLAAAAGGGAALSSLATALALRQGRGASSWPAGGRSRRRGSRHQEPWLEDEGPAEERGRQRRPGGGDPDAAGPPARGQPPRSGPERAPGEPPPTLSVPFRVIRRAAARSTSAAAPRAAAAAGPVAAGGPDAGDDWQESPAEDW